MEPSNALCSLLGTFSGWSHYLQAKQAHVKQTPKSLKGFCCSVRRFHHNVMPVTAGLLIFCQTEDPNRERISVRNVWPVRSMNGILTRGLFGVRGEQTDGYSIALADAVYTPIGFVAKTLYLTRSSLFVHVFIVHSSLLPSPTEGETYIYKALMSTHPSLLW